MGGFITKDVFLRLWLLGSAGVFQHVDVSSVCSSLPSTNCHNKYSGDAYYHNDKVVRIVMVGKTGAGKSATGNTILGKEYFKSEFSPKSLTVHCDKAFGEVDGQKVAVIDTPGLFDTRTHKEKTRNDIDQSITFASPGPHVFLVVIKLDRFTAEEKQSVQKIQEMFGEEADGYSMVLFTHGDLLKGKPIKKFLKESEDLQELVARCNGQYHVFNNEEKDRSQVRELLNKIRNIAESNGGSHYTNEMFQKAERAIEEKKQRILKEREEEIRLEWEKMEKKMFAKYEQQIKEMKDEIQGLKKLLETLKREMEEERRRFIEEQERKARQEAENTPYIIRFIKGVIKAVKHITGL